jgi:hypothetical protein
LVGLRVGLGVDGGGALGFEDGLVQHEHATETTFGELGIDDVRRVLLKVLEVGLRKPVVRLDEGVDVLDDGRSVVGRGKTREKRGGAETADRTAGLIDELSEVVLGGFNGVGVGLSSGGKTKCRVVKARNEDREFCGLRN